MHSKSNPTIDFENVHSGTFDIASYVVGDSRAQVRIFAHPRVPHLTSQIEHDGNFLFVSLGGVVSTSLVAPFLPFLKTPSAAAALIAQVARHPSVIDALTALFRRYKDASVTESIEIDIQDEPGSPSIVVNIDTSLEGSEYLAFEEAFWD